MSQGLQGARFHIEHIIPCSKGGLTREDNLALACPSCNLSKRDLLDASDPVTRAVVPLYHRRRDPWARHFAFRGTTVEGLSQTGRATVALLRMNDPRRLAIREMEKRLGWFPPLS